MEKIRVLVFEPHKKGYIKEIENHYKAFQKIVGGLITYVDTGKSDLSLIANDEGLLLGLPKDRGIYGTFLIVGNSEGESISITNKQIEETKKLFENRKNYQSKSKYLTQFFEEKDIEYTAYHITIEDTFFSIDSESVINHICAIEDPQIIESIENTIRKIDFYNGDMHHFLRFVAKLIAKSQYEEMKQ